MARMDESHVRALGTVLRIYRPGLPLEAWKALVTAIAQQVIPPQHRSTFAFECRYAEAELTGDRTFTPPPAKDP